MPAEAAAASAAAKPEEQTADAATGATSTGGRQEQKPGEFACFLKTLDAECQRKLDVMPQPNDGIARDPLLIAAAEEKERSLLRQARAKARVAAMDGAGVGSLRIEADWREQVRQRKEADRCRAAAEAKAATAAIEAAMQFQVVEQDATPMAVARRNWTANDRAREEERTRVAEIEEAGVRTWLDEEWLPQLENHRQQLRAQREAHHLEAQEQQRTLQRERDAMTCGDAASAAFVRFAAAECERRSLPVCMTKDPSVHAVAQELWAAQEAERQMARERQAQRQQAEESARRQEAEKQEREYKEWKKEIRVARCREARLDNATITNVEEDVEERRRQLLQQALLEDAIERATADTSRLKESGLSPRSILENTRKQAAFDKKQRVDKCVITNVEQEHWESLLAKNRRARQQERTSRTPRWGMFTT